MRGIGIVTALLMLVCSGVAMASPASSDTVGHYVQRTLQWQGAAHRYSVWLPPGFDRTRPWPGILFLHGAGECGTDAIKPTRVGLGPALQSHPEQWPFVVVFPQKPLEEDEWWEHEQLALHILDDAQHAFSLDPERIALVGMSQGGHGTWFLGARFPERWSALVPICGYGRPRLGRRVARIPVWAFHGLRDDIVDPADTRRITDDIRETRARLGLPAAGLRVTFYPDANHGSWEPAFREPDLPRWILAQRRAPTKPAH